MSTPVFNQSLARFPGIQTTVFINIWLLSAVFLSLFLVQSAKALDPSFSLDTATVNFATPTKETLDVGFTEKDSETNSYAVMITVDGGDGLGWCVYVKADTTYFSPTGYLKLCSDLKWKRDSESSAAYRDLTTSNVLVVTEPDGGPTTEKIDLKMLLDWSDPPDSYSLGLTFTLEIAGTKKAMAKVTISPVDQRSTSRPRIKRNTRKLTIFDNKASQNDMQLK